MLEEDFLGFSYGFRPKRGQHDALDALITGFELDKDARRYQEAMCDRLREFSLSLHPEKTRLIEFGRFAVERRAHRPSCSRTTRRTMSIGSTSTARSGRFSTSSLMRASNFTFPTMPTLRPKLRKVPRRSFSIAIAFDCSSLRCVSSIRSF